jgi:hypothetical protein
LSKKKKFDLTHLVHDGVLKDGETLYFVSDPAKTCKITKQPNNEYKVMEGKDTMTIHQFAVKCLGQEPPDHAAKWIRTAGNKTLYELWHADDVPYAA